MGMSPTKIDEGDGALTGVDGGVRIVGDVGSLVVEASSTCNLAFLRGGSPSVYISYNNHKAQVVSVNYVVNFDLIAECKCYISTTTFKLQMHIPFPLLLEAILVVLM
jgi:hypothetical protein